MYVYLFYKLIFSVNISLILLGSFIDSSLANALSGIISSFLISNLFLLLDLKYLMHQPVFFLDIQLLLFVYQKLYLKGNK